MKITKEWIAKSAGASVYNDARSLVARGKMIQVIRKGDIFQGKVDIGQRPMRVVVKVLGPHEIHTHCGCSLSRRTGALCEHGAALMLSTLAPKNESQNNDSTTSPSSHRTNDTKEKIQPVALEVKLSPRFPHEAVQAVHLRPAKQKNTQHSPIADTTDLPLTTWLTNIVGQAGPAMLSLPKEHIASFYRSLNQHPRVTRGDQPLQICTGRLCPPLEIDVQGEETKMKIVSDGLLMLGSAMAEWDEQHNRLTVDVSDTAKGQTLETMQAWQTIKTQQLIKMLPALGEIYHLPEKIEGLDIREATPTILLELSGSTKTLQARISACYPNNKIVCLTQKSTSSTENDFPIADKDNPSRWWVRNPDIEKEALQTLTRSGFQIPDNSGIIFLQGEEEVLDFLTTVLPRLRKQWKVDTETKLRRIEEKVERITPKINIVTQSNDWMACEVAWQCGDHTLNGDAVRKMLLSGQRTLKLPRGGMAVLSHFDSEVMDGFLLDTDPTQVAGQYRIPSNQAGYLNRLRDYYSENASSSSDSEEKQAPDKYLSQKLKQTLRPYQLEGVHWLDQRLLKEGAALLADDMGLGKTLQALACIQIRKNRALKNSQTQPAPTLIVCPATLLGNWRDEAAKFTPDLTVTVIHGNKRSEAFKKAHSSDILITSYALLDRDFDRYQSLPISLIILDEASAIRNPDTLVAKAVRKMNIPARMAITGTPVENSVRDLWSIFQFLLPHYLGSRKDFRLRYEVPCQSSIPDLAAMQRLRWRTEPFMLRRTKSDVAEDLPPKLESIVWCDPSPMQKGYYQSILRHGIEKIDAIRQQAGKEAGRMQMLTILLRLRQSCCDLRLLDKNSTKNIGQNDKQLDFTSASLADVSAKLARLMELLEEAQRGGHRVLVFSQFTSMLALIREELDNADTDYCYLDGSTRDRSSVVKTFQEPDGPPVFLISLKAGGYGLTLTAADTVIIFDPWWNPAVETQAADRIHRIGQTKPATIYKLITRGTVEEKIVRLQNKKRTIISAAMGEINDDTTPLMTGLTGDEMLELLK